MILPIEPQSKRLLNVTTGEMENVIIVGYKVRLIKAAEMPSAVHSEQVTIDGESYWLIAGDVIA